jgi:5'-nucleotidase
MKRILVDQDGVLANYEAGFEFWFRGLFPGYDVIPYEQRNTFYQEDQYGIIYPELKERIEAIPRLNGFYASLPLIRGAVEGIEKLAESNDVWICTSPKVDNPYCASEKFEWIRRFLREKWVRRTIITKDKTVVKGDYLIDDKPNIQGEYVPEWEQIVYDHPYNRGIEKKRFTWDKIDDFLRWVN